jgi:arginyl-tRNA synthetase
MTTVLHQEAEQALGTVLTSLGLHAIPPRLLPCPNQELGHAAVGSALPGAKLLKRAPMSIAADIAAAMSVAPVVARAVVAPPGYVNLSFADSALAAALEAQMVDPKCGIRTVARPERIVIDFGGPNIKPMHVGHLRSQVIGEVLRRMLIAIGHDVISDIHFGDWGLPGGMILAEIRHRFPDAPWFSPGAAGPFPEKIPVSVDDLSTLYPQASAACKADKNRMDEARSTTTALQAGQPGLSALWRSIVALAKAHILRSCRRLGAHFDLTLGESDAQPEIPTLLFNLEASGIARREGAALLIDVARSDDRHDVPPLVVAKGDGSALYATTELATILMRQRDLGAERILYIVDGRQHLHFLQVFRAAEMFGGPALEHIAFGTVNGSDGKPVRTRAGNIMGLVELLDLAKKKARDRLVDGGRLQRASPEVLDDVADAIGTAAIRIADLSSSRTTGYILDLDRALSFEGKTGPYLLYTLVRLRRILAKAGSTGEPIVLHSPAERSVALACLGLGDAVHRAVASRSPHELTAWAFDLAAAVSRFYAECPVLSENDPFLRASRIALCSAAEAALGKALDLLGCRVPAVM